MKFTLVLAIMAMFCFQTQAQQKIALSAKAGYNSSKIVGDRTNQSSSEFSSRDGMHLGLMLEIPISNIVSFQPEILYSTLGNKQVSSYISQNTTLEDKLRLDYISVPLIFKFYVFKGFSVELGPQVSFLVSAQEKTVGSVRGIDINNITDEKDLYSDVDAAVSVGLGYKLGSRMSLGMRFNAGLLNINNNEGGSSLSLSLNKLKNNEDFNSVFQLSLAYVLK